MDTLTRVPTRHSTRTCLLLTTCAWAMLLPAARGKAQEATGQANLGTIFLEMSGDRVPDDQTIVPDQVSSGSGLPSDVMESSATISVVTSAEIQQRGADTTEEVLQYTPGVTTDFYGRDDRFDYFNIRGYDAYSYRDGLFIGENFGGIREEPYAFDRVEILKGANSTAFGVADPGGAVNYITKSPTGDRLREIYGTVGSYAHKELGFDLGDSFAPGSAFSWRLTGKIKDAEAETDESNDDEAFLMGGLAWRPSDATTVSLVYDKLYRDGYPNSSGYPNVDMEFDRDLFLGEPGFNYLDTDRDTVTLKAEHDFGGGLSFGSTMRLTEGTGGYGYVFLGAPTSDTTASRFYFANAADYENFVIDANLLYETQAGALDSRTVAGVEYRDNHRDNVLWYVPAGDIDFTDPVYSGGLDLGSTAPYQSTTNDTEVRSVYLQQELTWDRVIAQMGLRQDWIDAAQIDRRSGTETSGEFSEGTGRLGLTYRATPNLSFYGSYAESVVPAGFGVEPERGEQYEIGVKYRPEGMRALVTASVFDLKKFNQTVTNPDTLRQETIGESRVQGFEIEAKAELTERLSLIAGYSYLDSEIVQSDNGTNDGNELEHTPDHSVALWADYLVPGRGAFGDLNLALGARYNSGYWTAADNSYETEETWIFDASAGYAMAENTELRLNVDNLFDEKHVAQSGFTAEYYNPGREVSLTLRHRW